MVSNQIVSNQINEVTMHVRDEAALSEVRNKLGGEITNCSGQEEPNLVT